ncbi:DUF4932 domain-containing protein [Dysgonomonas sp.]
MRKVVTLLLIIFSLNGFSQENQILDKPKVDKRVELLSIIARLADYNEYSNKIFKLYTDRIYKHFDPYKEHELIKFAAKLREERGVSYDAVMAMAIHLDDNLNPRVEFTDELPESRWGKENTYKFVTLLKEFYKDARCEEFFDSNKDLYKEVSRRFLPVYEELDIKWYSSFYGKEPSEKFKIVNGLGTGGGNYGVSVIPPSNEKEVYAIMGTWQMDSLGIPIFKKEGYFPTLLHEFNHSFVNHLIDINEDALKESGEKIFEKVKKEMAQQAYGSWKTVMYEALVRAAVIKYMKDHNFDQTAIDRETYTQLFRSFIWIRELVAELDKYSQDRETYPTLESYMPRIIEAYKIYVDNFDKYAEELDKERPIIVSIDEFANGDTDVDPTIETVTVNFDRPLIGHWYGVSLGGTNSPKDKYRLGNEPPQKDNKSLRLFFKLESNKEYTITLIEKHFSTPNKNYEINFKTE